MAILTRHEAVIVPAILLSAVMVMGGLALPAQAQTTDRTPLPAQLDVGSTGSNVSRLQTFLAASPALYPAAIISGYYGQLTKTAVTQFQIAYGLPPVGRVGPMTLAKINSLIAAGATPDANAPIITAVRVASASGNTTITWMTNESALGRVHYDTTPITMLEVDAPKTVPATSGLVIAEQNYTQTHSLVIPNISIGTATTTSYYFSLESIDTAGNVSVTLPELLTIR